MLNNILTVLTLLICLSNNCYSQFWINTSFDRSNELDTLSERVLEELKSLTTYVLIKPDCVDYIPLIEEKVGSFWEIGKIRIVTYDQYYDYLETASGEYHGVVDISGIVRVVRRNPNVIGGVTYSIVHYYLRYKLVAGEIDPEEYWSKKELQRSKKEGEKLPVIRKKFSLANYELYPGQSIIKDIDKVSRGKLDLFFGSRNIDLDDHMKRVILEGKFFNYEPGFLVNYLHLFNNYLVKNQSKDQFENVIKPMTSLKTKMLYVPDYVLERFNKFSGFRGKKFDEQDLMKGCEYEYQIVSSEALNKLILNSEEDIYFYTFIRGTTDAYHTVTNGFTGEVLYSKYDPLTYNIKSKNLKAISKSIE